MTMGFREYQHTPSHQSLRIDHERLELVKLFVDLLLDLEDLHLDEPNQSKVASIQDKVLRLLRQPDEGRIRSEQWQGAQVEDREGLKPNLAKTGSPPKEKEYVWWVEGTKKILTEPAHQQLVVEFQGWSGLTSARWFSQMEWDYSEKQWKLRV